jgi:hypothetical protein
MERGKRWEDWKEDAGEEICGSGDCFDVLRRAR